MYWEMENNIQNTIKTLLSECGNNREKAIAITKQSIDELKRNHPKEEPFQAFKIMEWTEKIQNLRDILSELEKIDESVELTLIDIDGNLIQIDKTKIDTYRGTDLPKNGTVIYYKDGSSVRVREEFYYVDLLINLWDG